MEFWNNIMAMLLLLSTMDNPWKTHGFLCISHG